ncbi:MAG: anti-sigma factor RsiW [Pseudohongiellaceae bacterium]|jgi:anti-sigma factor RsiW
MNDSLRELLIDYLDDGLPPSQRAEVEQLIAADPKAERFVSEHQEVWAALGEAFGEAAELQPSGDFRAQVVSSAESQERNQSQGAWPLDHMLALAACLALSLTLFTWLLGDRMPASSLSADDQQVVRHLHVLQEYDVVESMSTALDLRAEYDVMRAFEGELEG